MICKNWIFAVSTFSTFELSRSLQVCTHFSFFNIPTFWLVGSTMPHKSLREHCTTLGGRAMQTSASRMAILTPTCVGGLIMVTTAF